MRKIDGVESAAVSLNTGAAALVLKPGNAVSLTSIRERVARNGFTPKQAIVTARGGVVSTGGKLFFKPSGVEESYALVSDPEAPRLALEIDRLVGKMVLVEGEVRPQAKSSKDAGILRVRAIRQTDEK